MALKDWTNARDKNEFYNKKTKETIIIYDLAGRTGYWIKSNYFMGGKRRLYKHFKTKTQALKFAKSYMRKH